MEHIFLKISENLSDTDTHFKFSISIGYLHAKHVPISIYNQ